jgi:DNA-binding winged helix-turn-helix (wHTH) protein/tetratricopeptide (TPR) repeat protein
VYRFACFDLDDRTSVLFASGRPMDLARKVVETLTVLVERAGDVVSKEELLERLWPDGFVEESNITQNIYLLRRAFRAHGVDQAIEPVPRRGYRFVVPLAAEPSPVVGPATAAKYSAPLWTRAVVGAAVALVLFTIGAVGRGGVNPGRPDLSQAHSRIEALPAKDAQLYGLGRYYWSLRELPALKRSIAYFAQVVRDEPASALGYAGLADAYVGLYDYQCESHGCPDIAAHAQRAAAQAVAVDPSSAEGLTSHAMVLNVFEHDAAASELGFQRAIAANPRYALAHEWYGNLLLVQGRIAQARSQLEIAASLDPVSPATYAWLAHAAYFERAYGDAIAYAQRALSISPDRFETRAVLGLAYQQSGDDRRALSEFRQLMRGGDSEAARALMAGAYARAGQTAPAHDLLRSLDPRDHDIAFVHVALHRYDLATADLKNATFRNGIERAFFLMDPRLDAIRDAVRGDAI